MPTHLHVGICSGQQNDPKRLRNDHVLHQARIFQWTTAEFSRNAALQKTECYIKLI